MGSPKIFAHRGANDRFNESTITAYKLAANDGVDALEMDLRMTKDGSLVVMHDETIDRTTNGAGDVSHFTLEELKSFSTVAVFNQQTTMETIPTLEEVIQTFRGSEMYYIETRLVDGKLKMEVPLIQLLEKYDLINKDLVMIQSFSEASLKKVNELAPEIPLTLLFGKGKFDLRKALSVSYPMIGVEASNVTREMVDALHRNSKEVHVYFTNPDTQKEEQKRVKALNVDGYFTDYIHFTKKILRYEAKAIRGGT
ncbi:glycerophosphodiester phosphodiesterase [Lederbergia wuyishanensis]|uniref:Glycerophosphoryl diester phosphodiesterase/2,3-bisphosphoglycerate-dependent phosphoglycerate mutase n=1 Tax=Lederbergia wuyishanensis TaxID=1347903 RepID=A0ABU0D9X1_9BACI|nr:glycerophosphodiester phosphodiesterase family protein [Lederbergia wuyishanensis]MCJ8007431.1 glycerophosphodiester phosphodiesterase [Lederbergia wuyishanensis]MDQ0345131.1 glycerophosphoryl diester phosphodiesterase/2,3-bisphosphoglycerate-dependent phosphoglycerate mutase [Lederbergia wuyishanensis]